MAAPKPTVEITNQPQPVVVTTAPVLKPLNTTHFKKLRGLAIAEIVLGSICVIIGAAIAGIIDSGPFSYRNYRRYYSRFNRRYTTGFTTRYVNSFTLGEGIWCGVLIIVAGSLGIRMVRVYGSRCLITTHMAFCIVGSVFSGIMFIIGVFGAIGGDLVKELASLEHVLALYSLLCILAFVSMVLLILSATYSCITLGCCGEQGCCAGGSQGCCDEGNQDCNCCMPYNGRYAGENVVYTQQQAIGGQQVVYAQQSKMAGQPVAYAQQPAMILQGAPNPPPGYVVQSSQQDLQGTKIASANQHQAGVKLNVQNISATENAQELEINYENVSPRYQ